MKRALLVHAIQNEKDNHKIGWNSREQVRPKPPSTRKSLRATAIATLHRCFGMVLLRESVAVTDHDIALSSVSLLIFIHAI